MGSIKKFIYIEDGYLFIKTPRIFLDKNVKEEWIGHPIKEVLIDVGFILSILLSIWFLFYIACGGLN